MRFCRFHFVGLDASTATSKIWGCNTYPDLYMQYMVTAVHVPSPMAVLCITHNILFTNRVYINFPGIGLCRYKIVLKTALRNINIQLWWAQYPQQFHIELSDWTHCIVEYSTATPSTVQYLSRHSVQDDRGDATHDWWYLGTCPGNCMFAFCLLAHSHPLPVFRKICLLTYTRMCVHILTPGMPGHTSNPPHPANPPQPMEVN